MKHYCRCGEQISPARAKLAKTCLKCGEVEAQKEIEAKKLRVAPDGNKQGYSYQGDAETARRNILSAGKKNAVIAATTATDPYVAPPRAIPKPNLQTEVKRNVPPKRKVVGVYYIGQQSFIWYEGVDPQSKGATRMAKYEK